MRSYPRLKTDTEKKQKDMRYFLYLSMGRKVDIVGVAAVREAF